MKLTIEATSELQPLNGMPVRLWKGHDELGTPCDVYVRAVRVALDSDQSAFERHLIEIANPSLGWSALKRVALIAFRARWPLGAADAAAIAGVTTADLARAAAKELAGGQTDLESPAFHGVVGYMEALLTKSLPENVDGDHAWATVIGQHRMRLVDTQATVARLESTRKAQAKRITNLEDQLRRCLPFLETSDALGAGKLFHEVDAAVS